MDNLRKLLPFLSEGELEDLLNKVLSSPNYSYKDVSLKDLLVFLDQGKVDELFIENLKNNKDVKYFYPFVSHETLKNIVELYCNDKLDYGIDVNTMALFLEPEDIKLLYKYLSK